MLTKSVLNGKEINLTSDDINIKSDTLSIDKYGNMIFTGDEVNPNIKLISKASSGRYSELRPNYISFDNDDYGHEMSLLNVANGVWLHMNSKNKSITMVNNGDDFVRLDLKDGINETWVEPTGIRTPVLTQTSLAEQKKNFEKMQDNALDIINSIDIYKYNLKGEEDTDKKHLGFVIGKGYNYSKEVTNNDNTGVDNYSFTSLCCKAIQEQQAIIEQLKKEIEELKEERK